MTSFARVDKSFVKLTNFAREHNYVLAALNLQTSPKLGMKKLIITRSTANFVKLKDFKD